jgi:hypothetical protein
MQLLFVNEFDIICRADAKYVLSLVDLYRSIYGLPPIQREDEEIVKGNTMPSIESASVHQISPGSGAGSGDRESVGSMDWRLPEPEYWHPQEIVVLKLGLRDTGAHNEENDDEGVASVRDSVALAAVRVLPEDFARLLFCRVAVHHRLRYRERVDMIAQGMFNNLGGWGVESGIEGRCS